METYVQKLKTHVILTNLQSRLFETLASDIKQITAPFVPCARTRAQDRRLRRDQSCAGLGIEAALPRRARACDARR
jgi:hypothetical protein